MGDERNNPRTPGSTGRRRRRQLIGVCAVAATAIAGGALIVRNAWYGEGPHSGSTPEQSPQKSPAQDAGALPTSSEQRLAVGRIARLGLPIYRAGPRGHWVALTFDDGPGPQTATTLRKLRATHARATFFLVGRNLGSWPTLPAKEAAAGAVGDHTWTHPYLPDLTHAERLSQLTRTKIAASRASGQPIELFRPPYGGRNRAIDREAQHLGMLEVLWSTDSGDSGGANWQGIIRNTMNGLRPGAIILFHENRGQTQKALNRLLPMLRKKGYTAVSVPELLALDPPSLAQIRADARHPGAGVSRPWPR